MRLASSAEMAEIDSRAQSEYSLPAIVLMENAGAKTLAVLASEFGLREPVVFVVGRGNNGGDALVAARHAWLAGMRRIAVVLATGEPAPGTEPSINLASCRALGIEVLGFGDPAVGERLRDAAWILDGIAGTGLSGPLRPPLDRVVEAVNASPAHKASVDLPSGLRDGYRQGEPVVHADVTVALGLPKRCLYLPQARPFCGVIRAVDIGFPPALVASETLRGELLEARDLERLVPALPPDTYKNRRGHLAVFAGARGTSGAAWLAAHAAARARTGLVTVYAEQRLYDAVASAYTSVMIRPDEPGAVVDLDRFTAFLAGPGWGTGAGQRARLAQLLRSPLPGVLDADALALVPLLEAEEKLVPGPSRVLTPHPGEFARMVGASASEVLADPFAALEAASRRLGCVIVLKGHVTIVWAPDGRYGVLDGMNPALATGGSGDVLAGVIAGLLASGLEAVAAARAGVIAHAAAAERARRERGLITSEDLLPFVSQVLGFCCEDRSLASADERCERGQ